MIPSHDILARVMGLISPELIQSLYLEWNQFLSKDEGEKLKKVLNIDGKTIRGSGNKEQKALHVIYAWCHEDGMSLGQKAVGEKINEIIAIPKLLQELCLKKKVVTIDAIGTQVRIVEQIVHQKDNKKAKE